MEELLDLIINDESPLQTSDKIKEILFAKSSEKIDSMRPLVSNSMFGVEEDDSEEESDGE